MHTSETGQATDRVPIPPSASPPVEIYPILDRTRCRRVGECVLACPTACLDMTQVGPWLARPGDCVSCAVCVAVCPTEALRMDERGERS